MDHVTGNAVVCTAPPFALVLVSGELDLSTAPMLATRFHEAAAAGCRSFRVDLGAVRFCDVSTARVLAQVDRSMRLTGGSLRIVAASACVRRVLRLVGQTHLIEGEERVLTPQPA
ncbi:STAS domain-containing protein [Nocardioides caricicola]|uniref:STAS domain-containing protein n=1 Tax=Nocardioides caricicola TaxID=634770 RepID=A0ABW0N9L7_9ACTN